MAFIRTLNGIIVGIVGGGGADGGAILVGCVPHIKTIIV